MQNHAELYICIKIMHNTHLGEFSHTTYLLRVVERRVDAAVGCEHDANVGLTTVGPTKRDLILHSG
jgi:hypothetical protein